jgi:hypothetical protein
MEQVHVVNKVNGFLTAIPDADVISQDVKYTNN